MGAHTEDEPSRSAPSPRRAAAARPADEAPDARERDDLGGRLRAERERQRLGLRELARRVDVSASLISQVERGRTKPSVATLYAIASELGMTIDEALRGSGPRRPVPTGQPGPVVCRGERSRIRLADGVTWERLSNVGEGVEFVEITYDVGSESTPPTALMCHNGREFGVVVEGRLGLQIGFDCYELAEGDSVSFDSTRPHRLWAIGHERARAIWLVVGRAGDQR